MNLSNEIEKTYDVRFQTPCSIFVAGVSGAGKTHFIFDMLKNKSLLFSPGPEGETYPNIIYYYKVWQPLFTENENLISEWIDRPPTMHDLKEKSFLYKDIGGSIIIIDDSFGNLGDDISSMYTIYSHHHNCIPIFTSQNLFPDHKIYRNISLNSKYVIIFKNPRNSAQIRVFARQFSPGNSKYIIDAVEEILKKPHSYVLFDHHQKTADLVRVRSNILPHEQPIRVWVPSKKI